MTNINSYTDEFKKQIVALYQKVVNQYLALLKSIMLQEQLLINELSNLLIQVVLKLKIIFLI
ncbi:hypothetical protein [Spiroplasma ixodetis]|uniref:hypothetical protein n=1 Tax=Spiroplasma ixodetis TaxID=2141 RepID=UPI00257807B9|nr:hypothetical protein [Spiroplasma ixodetis]